MSNVHIITIELVVFLVGFVVAAQAFYRPLRIAWKLPLPRIFAGGLIGLSSWIAIYFALLLAVYYVHFYFGPDETIVLVAVVAAIPWVLRIWWFFWTRKAKRQHQIEADTTIKPDKETP